MTALAIESSRWIDDEKLVTVFNTARRRNRRPHGFACQVGPIAISVRQVSAPQRALASAKAPSLVPEAGGQLTRLGLVRLRRRLRIAGHICFWLTWLAGVAVAAWVIVAGNSVPTIMTMLG